MTDRTSRPSWVSESTLDADSRQPTSAAATLPCLTVLSHPALGRVGERAVLRSLLLRSAVKLSRNETDFTSPGGTAGRPLLDPFLSRSPIEITAGVGATGLRIECPKPGMLRVDGVPVETHHEVSREDLARGVLLDLRQRVLLLLHLTSARTPTDVPGLLGDSEAIEDVRRQIVHVAPAAVPVLVRGETGTGKELVARAIHALSPRADKTCIVVNMATIPETVAASALFGHEKGAFTGADRRSAGLFERASGGTLFLDELGETPDAVQPMLLRALETGCVLPVGAQVERPIDARFIAATDMDLEEGVSKGSFRAALLHRLSGYEIRVPPLRDRPDDIARLFVHFLMEEVQSLGEAAWLQHDPRDKHVKVPTDLMASLIEHPLPGNVRQLRNLVRQLVLGRNGAAQLEATADLRQALETGRPPAYPAAPGALTLQPPRPTEISVEQLERALEDNFFAPGKTAKALGIPTSTLHDLMARSGRLRLAKDIATEELRSSHAEHGGDTARMARDLRVSERALRMVLRERGLL